MIMARLVVPAAAAALALAPASGAAAQSISVQDSFRIGTGGSALCTAQALTTNPAFADMFDRGWSVVCRDASVPVGQLYALRTRGGDPAARLARIRSARAECGAPHQEEVEGLGTVDVLDCRLSGAEVTYRVYMKQDGNLLYAAEGLGGYDSALQLGLRTVVADRPVEGEVSVATTGAGDPAAFARVQAGSLDPERALAEAYRRNNAGNYAEASEFFGTLTGAEGAGVSRAEALANEALQESNLGRHAKADALFARADQMAAADPVTARRLRNYRAMHLFNQGRPAAALAVLERPLASDASMPASPVLDLVIDDAMAARLSAESSGSRQLGGASDALTPGEKAQILDAQAQQLRGTALRLQDRHDEAARALRQALDSLVAVRGGRVIATIWMRAQIHGDLADIADARGDGAEAERQHRTALALLETNYPGSSALLSAKGRLAAHYAEAGQTAQAVELYREIVRANAQSASSSPALRRTLAPYFALLAANGDQPQAAADLFDASQVLVRPGVAQTQAVLARELSGGSDEAARLFRQAVTLAREVERTRIDLARLEGLESPTPADAQRIAALRSSLDELQQEQVATQALLAQFPRYRAVSSASIDLAELQQSLRPGEAYYKMTVVGDDAYAVFATPQSARAFRIGADPEEIERQVDALRATISIVEEGQIATYPFDLETSHRLYGELFGPVGGDIARVTHLIFEPDGAMLRLPPNLLVMDEAGIRAYQARIADPADDGFDFTGVKWLGRERDISTAVSARAFRDVRQAPPSRARAEYIGFGQNAPANGFFLPASGTRGAGAADADCSWSLAIWNQPISAAELYTASHAVGDGAGATDIVIGDAFTDTAIKRRDDLDQYRIMHFATHGLVTAPRPECPARPALMTSFGEGESDGLLSFREIFDLDLDADLIILSACDTAGRASLAATREAGLTTGGDFALDGLVRAFVGAGGRLVVASHWPVPDDFDATQRLISGLFVQPPGTATASALREAQRTLMDDPATSHPYYWSGFAVVGDGSAPVVRAGGQGEASGQ